MITLTIKIIGSGEWKLTIVINFVRVRYERSHIFSRSKVIVKTMQSHRVSDIEYDAELSSSFAFLQLQPP